MVIKQKFSSVIKFEGKKIKFYLTNLFFNPKILVLLGMDINPLSFAAMSA